MGIEDRARVEPAAAIGPLCLCPPPVVSPASALLLVPLLVLAELSVEPELSLLWPMDEHPATPAQARIAATVMQVSCPHVPAGVGNARVEAVPVPLRLTRKIAFCRSRNPRPSCWYVHCVGRLSDLSTL